MLYTGTDGNDENPCTLLQNMLVQDFMIFFYISLCSQLFVIHYYLYYLFQSAINFRYYLAPVLLILALLGLFSNSMVIIVAPSIGNFLTIMLEVNYHT